MPLQYLNIYIIFFIGSILVVFAGVGLCYTGLSELGFNVYRGMELTTYYLDKNRYDLYLNGLVYCITFGAALLLLLAVILIPSADQIQRRISASPYGTPAVGTPPTAVDTEETDKEDSGIDEDILTPQIEDFSGEVGLGMESPAGEGDSDVVEGTGSINEESQAEFLKTHPESAVKFLMRKNLDDSPLDADDEEVHETWQGRGLSRGELRRHVMKLMEWEEFPESSPTEILNQIKEKVTA